MVADQVAHQLPQAGLVIKAHLDAPVHGQIYGNQRQPLHFGQPPPDMVDAFQAWHGIAKRRHPVEIRQAGQVKDGVFILLIALRAQVGQALAVENA